MSKLAPSFLLLLASPLLAQTLPPQQPSNPWDNGPESPCISTPRQNTIEWPPSGPAAFGRIVIAELDGDQSPDGVAVEGGEAVAFWSLAVYDASELIAFPLPAQPPVSVADIAVLPGGGSVPGTDAVLMTDARGLFRVRWSNGAFETPYVINSSPNWLNAAPIHVDDLDMDGQLDVYGLSADKRKVLTLMGPSFASGFVVPEPIPARDVVAVDWNDDGLERELAVLSNRWLHVRDAWFGSLQQTVSYTALSGSIERVRMNGDSEVLAWTRAISSSASELIVFAGGVQVDQEALAFSTCGVPQLNPTALAAGDYDFTAGEELLLVHQSNQTAVVLANQGAPQYFTTNNPSTYDVIALSEEPLNGGGIGIPAFGQIDDVNALAGDPSAPEDFVFPMSVTSRIEVFANPAHERAIQGGQVNSATVIEDETEYGHRDLPPVGELRFAFRIPTQYVSYPWLDMVLWSQNGQGEIVGPGVRYRHTLLSGYPTQWVHVVPTFFPGLCSTDGSNKPIYYTEIRFVKNGANGEIRSPIFTGGFTLEDCADPQANTSSFFNYLIPLGIPGEEFYLRQDNGLSSGLIKEIVGLYVPMSSQPPFSNGRPNVVNYDGPEQPVTNHYNDDDG